MGQSKLVKMKNEKGDILPPQILLILIINLILIITKLLNSSQYFFILINTIIEITFFLIIYSILNKKTKIREVIYYIIQSINFILFLITSFYFNEYLILKYNFNQLNYQTFLFFLESIISYKRLLLIIISIISIIIITKLISKNINKIIPKISFKFEFKYILFIFLLISGILLIIQFQNISNIYINTIYDIIEEYRYEKIIINLNTLNLDQLNYSQFNKNIKDYKSIKTSNQNVFIFVMEQTTYNEFMNQQKKIPDNENFFKITQNHSNLFTNYYTSNQDSRTAIWTMLTSSFIPYESYINDWNKKYGNIIYEKNLVQLFNKLNYTTIAAASVLKPSLIISAYPWQQIISPKNYNLKNSSFFCLNELKYQTGCEDNLILKDVKKTISENKNKKIFFMQEFIYGHGSKYFKKINKNSIEYYNQYLLKVYNHLKEEKILNNSIIIVISDHGKKNYGNKKITEYQIPLFIYNSKLENKNISQLYSHLNFKDILLNYLSVNNQSMPKNENNFFIGQTQSNELGYINSNNKSFLLKQKSNEKFLVKKTNMNLSSIKENLISLLEYKQSLKIVHEKNSYYCTLCQNNSYKFQ